MPPGETGKLCSLIQPDKKVCHRTTKAIQDGKCFTGLSKESDSLEHQVRKHERNILSYNPYNHLYRTHCGKIFKSRALRKLLKIWKEFVELCLLKQEVDMSEFLYKNRHVELTQKANGVKIDDCS